MAVNESILVMLNQRVSFDASEWVDMLLYQRVSLDDSEWVDFGDVVSVCVIWC